MYFAKKRLEKIIYVYDLLAFCNTDRVVQAEIFFLAQSTTCVLQTFFGKLFFRPSDPSFHGGKNGNRY